MKTLLVSLCLTLSSIASYAQDTINTAGIEPKTQFQLNVNDTFYFLNEKELLNIGETLVKPKVSIQLADFKKFNSGYVSFEYPRPYTFEYSEEPGASFKSWTLSGNNITVILFQFGVTVSIDDMMEEMQSKFGKRNCKVTSFRKKLGIKTCEGRRLGVSLAGQLLNMDFYILSSTGENSIFIAFQSTLNDDGTDTKDYKAGFKTIDNSISY